jgi:hypothetical protein
LRAQYLPQLAAYWAAIWGMTGMHVEAAIYSTATAAVLHYEEKELAREWARLKALPPDELAAQVARSEDELLPAQMEFADW